MHQLPCAPAAQKNQHVPQRAKLARPPLHTIARAKSSTAQVSGRLRGEENDNYPHIVAALNANWRVIAVKIQFNGSLQRRRGGADHWRGYWHCRTREALMRGVHQHAGDIAGHSLVRLLRLPERFQEAVS